MSNQIVKSEPRKISKSDHYLYSFLSDFRNFIAILPEDKIENWESDENSCTFTIIGLARLKFIISEKIPNKSITYNSSTLETMPLTLVVNFNASSEEECIAQIALHTSMSPMIFMFAEKQLKNLVEKMTEKMQDL